jgi:hypothetical protein
LPGGGAIESCGAGVDADGAAFALAIALGDMTTPDGADDASDEVPVAPSGGFPGESTRRAAANTSVPTTASAKRPKIHPRDRARRAGNASAAATDRLLVARLDSSGSSEAMAGSDVALAGDASAKDLVVDRAESIARRRASSSSPAKPSTKVESSERSSISLRPDDSQANASASSATSRAVEGRSSRSFSTSLA